MEKPLEIRADNFSKGYYAQLEGRSPDELSQPSINCRLTRLGEVYTRPGYMDTTVSLGMSGKSNVMGFRMVRKNLTFFSGGTSLVYSKDSGTPAAPFSTPVDTGLTLTDGTYSTFSEYFGDVFLTNATDGLWRISVMSLGAAASASDAFLNLSTGDGFKFAAGNVLRVAGTNFTTTTKPTQQALTSLTAVGTTATAISTGAHGLITGMQTSVSGAADNKYNGVYTITKVDATTFTYTIASGATTPDTGTSIITPDSVQISGTVGGSGYASGEIVIYVDTPTNTTSPKGSKNVFWIESANVIGVSSNFSTNYVTPSYTHFYADSADSHAAGGMAKAYTFSGGKSGTNAVGQRGVLTNIISTNDYLFLFTEWETYKISNADVVISSGARVPRLFSNRYGCANQFCAVTIESDIVWLPKFNKRIIKSKIGQQTNFSYATIYPDESFDRPILDLLLNLDDDQSSARMWYWTKGRLLFVTCRISGQKMTLVYDNNIQVWLPPDTNKPINSYFEVNGELYATQDTDQTVYHLEYGSSDNLSPIEWVVAPGILRAAQGEGGKGITTCDFEEMQFVGSIAQNTNLTYRPLVDITKVGAYKTMPQSAATFGSGSPIGSVGIGAVDVGGNNFSPDLNPCAYRMYNSPSVGFGIQPQWRVFQDGGSGSIKSYKITGKQFSDSFITSH